VPGWCHDQLVRLAYLDESSTKTHYFIGALVVDESAAVAIHLGLDGVARAAGNAMPGAPDPLELHAYPMFHFKGEWAAFIPTPRAGIAVYNQAVKVIARTGVHFLNRGVTNLAAIQRRDADPCPPHSIALQHTLERLDRLGAQLGEQILVICDDISDPNLHRASLRSYQLHGTPGYRSSRLPHILDTVHFAPSKHSRLLQAVDLVTFMHQRRFINANAREMRIWNGMHQRLATAGCLMASSGVWHAPTHEGPARSGA